MTGEAGEPNLVDETTVAVPHTHSIGGNPIRFTTGQVAIRPDLGWTRRQSPAERLVPTALSLPCCDATGIRSGSEPSGRPVGHRAPERTTPFHAPSRSPGR